MNPLYQQLMGGMPQQAMRSTPMFQNPMQKMAYMMRAMQNPAAFVKNAFPDIPNEIQNDPIQILGYLQRTRGITDQDIKNVTQQFP